MNLKLSSELRLIKRFLLQAPFPMPVPDSGILLPEVSNHGCFFHSNAPDADLWQVHTDHGV